MTDNQHIALSVLFLLSHSPRWRIKYKQLQLILQGKQVAARRSRGIKGFRGSRRTKR